ncbi:hypothetical protein DA2_2395 [Desulfovibrio sp. A2]|nr:hypothetical protein DA2_2395 [Desulfovibrio sp. A2]
MYSPSPEHGGGSRGNAAARGPVRRTWLHHTPAARARQWGYGKNGAIACFPAILQGVENEKAARGCPRAAPA